MLLFESHIRGDKAAFIAKLQSISNKLGVDAEWLMIVMMHESNLDPQARNNGTQATGLIQFIPSTAKGLGTSVGSLYNMSSVEQLNYVYLYLKPKAGKYQDVGDLYMYILFPAAVGKADDYILQTSSLSAATVARSNPLFDANKDQKITVGEVKNWFQNWIRKRTGDQKFNIKTYKSNKTMLTKYMDYAIIIGLVIVVIALSVKTFKK